MNKPTKDQGNAHVIVVLLAIIVILGGLGYVYFVNLGNKSQPVATQSTPATILSFPDLKISVPVSNPSLYSTTKDTQMSEGVGTYFITSSRVKEACSKATPAGYSSVSGIGMITKYISDASGADGVTNKEYISSTITSPSVFIEKGDYIYVYRAPQQSCSDPNTSEGKTANAIQSAAITAFAADFKNLVISD